MNSADPSDPSVIDTLRRAAGVHSRHRAMTFILRAAFWLLLSIPVLMLIDVLFHFSDHLRLASGIGVICVILLGLGIAVSLACFIRPPLLRIARLLETRNPELGSKLMNILQLESDAENETATPLTRSLARRAVVDAGRTLDLPALPKLAREPQMKQRGIHLISGLCAIALLSIFGGKHVRNEWLRFLDPFGDHPPFSLTHLEISKPKQDEKVLYGSSSIVEVVARGHQPKDVFLTAKSIDGKSSQTTLPMSARGDGTFIVLLENIQHNLELTAHTADQASRSHRKKLEVLLTPQIENAIVKITPPAYTGKASSEIPYRFTSLQALEGSQVHFQVHSNRPLGKGKMIFESEAPSTELILSPIAEGQANVAHADLTATQSGRFTFHILDVSGNAAADKPSGTMTVTKDLPPAIAISKPEQDASIVENFSFPITVDATDDYGLRSMRLHVGIKEEFQKIDPLTFEKPDVRRHQMTFTLDLKKLGAHAGDEITIFAEAIDTRPDPQITRTSSKRLTVISEEEYNKRIRENANVALIAGKYEDLLSRFQKQIQTQKEIEEKLADLRKQTITPDNEKKVTKEFVAAYAEQNQLNEQLNHMADEMENFGRDKPTYDFEKDLHDRLKKQAQQIRESTKVNQAEIEKAIENVEPTDAPKPELLDQLKKSAADQHERLQGGSDKSQKEIQEPLKNLAEMHELMRDFKRFEELAQQQKELAEQSKAYQDKPALNAEDRLALRDLGAQQRDLAQKIDQLERKLRQDAEAAKEASPQAAESAKELADQMNAAGMSGLARQAAQNLLEGKAKEGHDQAKNLHAEMDKLMWDTCQNGLQNMAQELDRELRANRNMNPGDSLNQMLLSKLFPQLPGEQGQSGTGAGGFMSSSSTDMNAQLLGGESLMNGPIASAIAGRGNQGNAGLGGGPTAQLDRPDEAKIDEKSARRTNTPGSNSLLMEYENMADAYFHRLTTKP